MPDGLWYSFYTPIPFDNIIQGVLVNCCGCGSQPRPTQSHFGSTSAQCHRQMVPETKTTLVREWAAYIAIHLHDLHEGTISSPHSMRVPFAYFESIVYPLLINRTSNAHLMLINRTSNAQAA